MPGGSGQLGTVMLLIIGIVGTTVAPWQLFFQQLPSTIIDKRITPAQSIPYEKADLVIGIAVVIVGGAALDSARQRAAFVEATSRLPGITPTPPDWPPGSPRTGGKAAGALFAVALLDAAMIGAFAVSLSTAYALGDVLGPCALAAPGKVRQAKVFYVMYGALIAGAATIVLIPGSPLGLFTEGVQVLAGVLLPSATVFLLLLCNDKAVLGPWVNGRFTNAFTGAVIALLVMLSLILVASVTFPHISSRQILMIMIGFAGLALIAVAVILARGRRQEAAAQTVPAGGAEPDRLTRPVSPAKENWRMPALTMLAPAPMSVGRRLGLAGMWIYLAIIAVGAAVFRIAEAAMGH